MKRGVERIQRHLHRIERKARPQHLQMDLGRLVAGEANEAHLALLFRLRQRLGRASRADKKLRIIIEPDAVNLPEVQVVGLQSAQGFLEHPHGKRGVPSVRANLGHKENLIPQYLEFLKAFAHPVLRFPPVILPAIVKKRHSSVDRLANDLDRGFFILRVAEVMPSESKGGDLDARRSKTPERN